MEGLRLARGTVASFEKVSFVTVKLNVRVFWRLLRLESSRSSFEHAKRKKRHSPQKRRIARRRMWRKEVVQKFETLQRNEWSKIMGK
jgi:hypothetical protein